MIYAYIPAIVCIAGALVYALSSPNNPKAAELGRIAYWCGLLVTVWELATKAVHLP